MNYKNTKITYFTILNFLTFGGLKQAPRDICVKKITTSQLIQLSVFPVIPVCRLIYSLILGLKNTTLRCMYVSFASQV